MPPDRSTDLEDDQYASSEDSDFVPVQTFEHASDKLESGDEVAEFTSKKQRLDEDTSDTEDGYDNSGDEAIIQKGRKRQKRERDKGGASDNDGGEGGLVKTRRQRAMEYDPIWSSVNELPVLTCAYRKAERVSLASRGPVTVDVDALWEQMISGEPLLPSSSHGRRDEPGESGDQEDTSKTIRITRTYNFAGRVHTEEKVVARDSAEAKLYLASRDKDDAAHSPPMKRAIKKAFRSAFEPVLDTGPGRMDLNLGVLARTKAASEARARKLNTVEKSRMDWAGYVDKEGIQSELELAGKSKDSYTERQGFLARSEAIREDEARKARMAARA